MENKSQALMKKQSDALIAFDFKVPVQPSGTKKQKVLSEDAFAQGISKIIERDFFPDIPKLEAQFEYFEAIEKNDLVKLREIQMRFGRPDTGTTDGATTPLTFETPLDKRKPTPGTSKKDHQPSKDKGEPDPSGTHGSATDFALPDEGTAKTPKLKLDAFLSRNTSEDSASFEELINESERKRRLKHDWVFEKEKEQLSEHNDFIALPPIEEQAAIKDKPTHINTWKYINHNAVMYVPEGVSLSAKEEIEAKRHKPQAVIHENTRFMHNPFGNSRNKDAMRQAASFKALINQGKIGHDGKEMLPSDSPNVNGYGFVGTPSPAPGVADSPMMTWGEIDSTPSRLDINNDALPSATPGPVFRIPDVPKRERLALELSEKASKAHRAKKEAALKQVTRRFASPSPQFKSLSSVERISNMSPAAQRLASKRLGIKVSTDKALAASYSPSPTRGTRTPTRLTPNSRRSSRSGSSLPGTPGGRTPVSERSGSSTPLASPQAASPSLTDHLLKLPKRSRKNASDFF